MVVAAVPSPTASRIPIPMAARVRIPIIIDHSCCKHITYFIASRQNIYHRYVARLFVCLRVVAYLAGVASFAPLSSTTRYTG